MMIKLTGFVRPQNLEKVIAPIAALLAEHGVEKLNDIRLTFLAWGAETRRQIVDGRGLITPIAFDGEDIVSSPVPVTFVMPDHLSFRDRPDMKESVFAIAMRHDD